jgi:hypothetical protein
MEQIKKNEIEKAIYGKSGLFARTVYKIEEIGKKESIKMIGKKRQSIDTYCRQFYHPEKFDYRPQPRTIMEFAEKLGIE